MAKTRGRLAVAVRVEYRPKLLQHPEKEKKKKKRKKKMQRDKSASVSPSWCTRKLLQTFQNGALSAARLLVGALVGAAAEQDLQLTGLDVHFVLCSSLRYVSSPLLGTHLFELPKATRGRLLY